MKKTLIALMALAGVACGLPVEENIIIGNTAGEGITVVNGKTGLDPNYVKYPNTTITTVSDSVEVWAMYYDEKVADNLATENASLTLNIKNSFTARDSFYLGTDDTFRLYVNTEITDTELSTLNTAGIVSRTVITCNNGISNFDFSKVSLTLQGVDGYAFGGNVMDFNGTYYSASDFTKTGGFYTIKDGAKEIELAANTVYTTFKIAGTTGANIKGIGFLAVPEPATATLSLLALVGLCARRRRA